MANIRTELIISNWMTIIEYGAGQGERIYNRLDLELKNANIPNVSWGRENVNAGMMSKNGREFLVIRNAGLQEYTMFVFARDVGAHLDCGWFTTVQPGFLKKTFSKKMTGDPLALSQNLGVFAQQDLSSWTSITHRAFKRIVTEIMGEMDQDITGMNTQSKGYLSVW